MEAKTPYLTYEDIKPAPPDSTKIEITDNTITGAGRFGIRATKLGDSQISNNNILGSKKQDLVIAPTTEKIVLQGNACSDPAVCSTV